MSIEFHKHALILKIVENLHRRGSWTGKTHVNKALSLLQDKDQVEVPFRFVLYKHGPYSFDVETELEQMQSYGALVIEPNAKGYGVKSRSGEGAELVPAKAQLSTDEVQAIETLCEFVGNRNVAELERLATASWIRKHEKIQDPQEAAKRLNELKPHISLPDAQRAFDEVSAWLDQTTA